MKRSVLLKQLRRIAQEQGVAFVITEGCSHSKVRLGSRFVVVPRHKEIDELTTQGILRDAEGG
jgi:mRNA interferase HicA